MAQTTSRYVRLGFYVRPIRTLVEASVASHVGGPGNLLWRSGWSMGIGMADLPGIRECDLPDRLMSAFLLGDDLRRMSPEQKQAWIRTWRHADV